MTLGCGFLVEVCFLMAAEGDPKTWGGLCMPRFSRRYFETKGELPGPGGAEIS